MDGVRSSGSSSGPVFNGDNKGKPAADDLVRASVSSNLPPHIDNKSAQPDAARPPARDLRILHARRQGAIPELRDTHVIFGDEHARQAIRDTLIPRDGEMPDPPSPAQRDAIARFVRILSTNPADADEARMREQLLIAPQSWTVNRLSCEARFLQCDARDSGSRRRWAALWVVARAKELGVQGQPTAADKAELEDLDQCLRSRLQKPQAGARADGKQASLDPHDRSIINPRKAAERPAAWAAMKNALTTASDGNLTAFICHCRNACDHDKFFAHEDLLAAATNASDGLSMLALEPNDLHYADDLAQLGLVPRLVGQRLDDINERGFDNADAAVHEAVMSASVADMDHSSARWARELDLMAAVCCPKVPAAAIVPLRAAWRDARIKEARGVLAHVDVCMPHPLRDELKALHAVAKEHKQSVAPPPTAPASALDGYDGDDERL